MRDYKWLVMVAILGLVIIGGLISSSAPKSKADNAPTKIGDVALKPGSIVISKKEDSDKLIQAVNDFQQKATALEASKQALRIVALETGQAYGFNVDKYQIDMDVKDKLVFIPAPEKPAQVAAPASGGK